MKLSEIKSDMTLSGLVPGEAATIIRVNHIADTTDITDNTAPPVVRAITVIYRTESGQVAEAVLFEKQAANLTAAPERRWTFDSDGDMFRLASEARRIQLAHLFDPYTALSEASIDPLPHQIEAVYQRLLPVQPLRFLLADDPGAGKTIMSGLFIKELLLRGGLERCLIVVPGGLIEQWQGELREKFNLHFDILTRDRPDVLNTSVYGARQVLLLARMDQLARNDNLLTRLSASEWDLAIVDEAHKMSAARFGMKVNKTKRFQLGEKLRDVAHNLLLLTATPHNGKDNDFLMFLTLLDEQRFDGELRNNEPLPDITDIMRRTVKENLLTFQGKPLFPERRAQSLTFELSGKEQDLYDRVTEYVREGFNRVEQLLREGDRQANAIGFVLTMLQRRLASSPAAIHESLKRRRERLEDQLRQQHYEVVLNSKAVNSISVPAWNYKSGKDDKAADDSDWDDYSDAEIEKLETDLAAVRVTEATLKELREEVAELRRLEALAKEVRESNVDRKWDEVAEFLRSDKFSGGDGKNKLIVFTEHKDTLHYLVERITALLGDPKKVIAIHGGVPMEQRRSLQDRFTTDPVVRVLVATDAAGEGVNLQRANLMVNYDLPWNPNRIEQRFGRIHRIGQTKPCFLWNLVAESTREGRVFQVLLNKIEQQRLAYGGRVYDTLGDPEVNKSLRKQLMEAIRYGDDPGVMAKMEQVIDSEIGGRTNEVLKKNALADQVVDLEEIRDRIERAQARKLQPGFVEAFFKEAIKVLGGRLSSREDERFEVTRVPLAVRTRELQHQARIGGAIHERYERITFQKEYAQTRNGKWRAQLIAPGHPLLSALIDTILEQHGKKLESGATLVDESDDGLVPRVLVYLEHSVTDGRTDDRGSKRVVSRRFQFVEVSRDGETRDPGADPYLNYEALKEAEQELVAVHIETAWADTKVRDLAQEWATLNLALPHLEEIERLTTARVSKVREAVEKRLNREIQHCDLQVHEFSKQERVQRQEIDFERQINKDRSQGDSILERLWNNELSSRETALSNLHRKLQSAQKRARELVARRDERLGELDAEAALVSQPPKVVGAALVIPRGLLRELLGTSAEVPVPDPEIRAETDRRAIAAVMDAERKLGREPEEQKHNNPGFDILSRDPSTGMWYQLEVKGHRSNTPEIKVSMVQVRQGKQNPERFRLVVVKVPRRADSEPWVRYFVRPFDRYEPHFAQGYLPLRVTDLPIVGVDPQ